jgi:hypothetical protein
LGREFLFLSTGSPAPRGELAGEILRHSGRRIIPCALKIGMVFLKKSLASRRSHLTSGRAGGKATRSKGQGAQREKNRAEGRG